MGMFTPYFNFILRHIISIIFVISIILIVIGFVMVDSKDFKFRSREDRETAHKACIGIGFFLLVVYMVLMFAWLAPERFFGRNALHPAADGWFQTKIRPPRINTNVNWAFGFGKKKRRKRRR